MADCNGDGIVFPIVSEKYCRASEERLLTVQKTSFFYPGDGFAVYEHNRGDNDHSEGEEIGELIFRVDSYGCNFDHVVGKRSPGRDELILMGPCGDCILSVRKKWPSLHQRWEGFLGEKMNGQKPLFSARRNSIVGKSTDIVVDVYGSREKKHQVYRVEGSFSQRSCTVYEESIVPGNSEEANNTLVVAEIRRKTVASSSSGNLASSCMLLGSDVFCLWLMPGVDAAFLMGLVLVLDKIMGQG
ncbi:protein LURP-one-related 5-like [Wolffia australiana]